MHAFSSFLYKARNVTHFKVHTRPWNQSKTNLINVLTKTVVPLSSESWIHCSRCANQRKSNIILMGSPGSGKTTVGKLLGPRLGMPVLDIDDHHLEPYWGMSVADKLAEVGSDSFVEEEGKALLNFECQGSVVSLTGSNPMFKEAMSHISRTGIVVFLDAQDTDILERLERMKVSRIVGQTDGVSMESILDYRQQFYEGSYDIRIMYEKGEPPESVAEKVKMAVQYYNTNPGYTSTRNEESLDEEQTARKWSFSDVVLKGLAPDGGLFVPASYLPCLSAGELKRLVNLDYNSRALRILERFINPSDLHPSKLRSFIDNAYNNHSFGSNSIFPIKHLQGNQYLLELFHGPTASFKDAALQLMPQFFVEAVEQSSLSSNSKYLIIVATSGDTGGAVLDGFARHAETAGIGVMVMYPDDGVSDVQKQQMTSMTGNNVHVVGVRGDFDVCQSFVKRALKDVTLAQSLENDHGLKLSAANSISWGRLVPQVVYHVSSYMDLVKSNVINFGDEVDLCIPTGNFGNILAAYYAKVLGIPYRRLICASNANNILTDFINTGTYDIRQRTLQQTASPAIDILVSSNLERYMYHASDGSSDVVRKCYQNLESSGSFSIPSYVWEQMRTLLTADWCTEEQCKATIQKTLQDTGYLLDPHTAIGVEVGNRFNRGDCPMIIASTAHYAKFGPEISSMLPEFGMCGFTLKQINDHLNNMCTDPASHEHLLKSVYRPRIHVGIVDAEYGVVIQEIQNMARSL